MPAFASFCVITLRGICLILAGLGSMNILLGLLPQLDVFDEWVRPGVSNLTYLAIGSSVVLWIITLPIAVFVRRKRADRDAPLPAVRRAVLVVGLLGVLLSALATAHVYRLSHFSRDEFAFPYHLYKGDGHAFLATLLPLIACIAVIGLRQRLARIISP